MPEYRSDHMPKTGVKKLDNASIPSKVAIRRWLLERMQISDAYVLDTCAGAGHVWDAMRAHVRVRQWTRCDIRPRRGGTLGLAAADAVRALPLDTYNVIDIDPYGEPWDPFLAVLERLRKPTAIFLTRGCMNLTGAVSNAVLRVIGIPDKWPYPRTKALPLFADELILRQTWTYARIDHAARLAPSATVTYYALGVSPKEG